MKKALKNLESVEELIRNGIKKYKIIIYKTKTVCRLDSRCIIIPTVRHSVINMVNPKFLLKINQNPFT